VGCACRCALDAAAGRCNGCRFGSVAREIVCRVATTAPQQLGLPFTTWSLSKLVEHLGAAHRIVASTETVRKILREAGISWQATKT